MYQRLLNFSKLLYYILQTNDEDVGEIYQDEVNQAAIMLREAGLDGAIIVVSDIFCTNRCPDLHSEA